MGPSKLYFMKLRWLWSTLSFRTTASKFPQRSRSKTYSKDPCILLSALVRVSESLLVICFKNKADKTWTAVWWYEDEPLVDSSDSPILTISSALWRASAGSQFGLHSQAVIPHLVDTWFGLGGWRLSSISAHSHHKRMYVHAVILHSFCWRLLVILSLWLGEWVPRWQALRGSVMIDSEKDRVSSPVGKRIVV